MGVKGLTGWVKYRHLGVPAVLSNSDPNHEPPIPWVLDALAFLYQLQPDSREKVRGGQYTALRVEIRHFIEYWRACGLEPIFVWDGPCGAAKLGMTSSKRTQEHIEKAIALRTAMQSNGGSILLEYGSDHIKAARLPPLLPAAVGMELRNLDVKQYFAEGEADSPVAELAQHLNGYCVSNDSDYFIFNAAFRGYVPIQEIGYGLNGGATIPLNLTSTSPRRMRFNSYCHQDIASALDLPPNYLPIFAALVSNDISDYADQIAMIPRTLYYRVDRGDLARIIKTLARIHDRGYPADTGRDVTVILKIAVTALFVRQAMNEPLSEVLATLLQSTQSYQLHSITDHQEDFPFNPKKGDSPGVVACRKLYRTAYSKGQLGLVLAQIVKILFCDLPFILEDMSVDSACVSVGRPIREWIYGMFENSGMISDTEEIEESVIVGGGLKVESIPIYPLQYLYRHLLQTELPDFPKGGPLLLESTAIRLREFFRILPTPPSCLRVANFNSLEQSPFSTFVLALRHLRLTLPNNWNGNAINSAILVAVFLAAGITSLPSTRIKLPSSTYESHQLEMTSVQRSAEYLQALFHIRLLAESMLLTRFVPAGYEYYDGAMFHYVLNLTERISGRTIFEKFLGLTKESDIVKQASDLLRQVME